MARLVEFAAALAAALAGVIAGAALGLTGAWVMGSIGYALAGPDGGLWGLVVAGGFGFWVILCRLTMNLRERRRRERRPPMPWRHVAARL